jgi:Replication initiator protein, pSAM2
MEKLLLTVWEAADVLSVSRSRVYELLYAEQPVWTGAGYCDPDTGVMLPTWRQALDHLDADPDAGPVHVMRFGTHHDIAGIIAPSADADRAVRYLAKYLTKAIGDPLGDNSESDPAREAHSPPSGGGPPSPSVAHSSASPDNPPIQGRRPAVKGERSEFAGPERSDCR